MIFPGLARRAPAQAQAQPDFATLLPDIAERVRRIFDDRFQVLTPIAIGGMATLFKMKHRLHNGLFAAKILHPHLMEKPGIVDSFQAEAAHAARLGVHPNAVPVFDFGQSNGLHFMTMPFIEGEDLDKILRRQGAFAKDDVLAFAAQIASLLCFAESEAIVHCDLSPANIRLDSFGFYRLLDFGISQSQASTQDRGFTGGTPLYASPEHLRGESPSTRSDLYSLGAILAEMLTGDPLFRAPTIPDIERRHLLGDWQIPPAFAADADITQLLQRLLAARPEDRFPSAVDLATALAALGFSRPQRFARRDNPGTPLPSATRRPRLSSQ